MAGIKRYDNPRLLGPSEFGDYVAFSDYDALAQSHDRLLAAATDALEILRPRNGGEPGPVARALQTAISSAPTGK